MKKRMTAFILSFVCYLGLHNGYLALFDENNPQPLLVLPYKEQTYSPSDRAALQRGIPYQTNEELTRLLEDFLS